MSKARAAAFVVFAIFVCLSAGYVAGKLSSELGADDSWAALAFGIVFGVTAIILDRVGPP